jgi:hypothetical protein
MTRGCVASVAVLAFVVAHVSLTPVRAQARRTAASASASSRTWKLPRTAWGHPDLQGVWANNNATPLERPKELASRQFLTDTELAAVKSRAAELFNGDGDAAFGDQVFIAAVTNAKEFVSRDGKTGDYNHFWLVERDFDNRTSLITDPPDGKLPALTPDAEKRAAERTEARKRSPADGPEDRSLSERCITFGSPRLGAGYNSYYQIFQTPDSVAIAMETIHDARIIPLDGRPHVGPSVRQWLGDSRGHWEGDTLVVDTTNYSAQSRFMGSTENLHVIERFTRVGPRTINYEITVDDPQTWTKPWTAMIPLKQSPDQIYEYACHEGNTGLYGILSGARAEEKAAAEAARKTSSK